MRTTAPTYPRLYTAQEVLKILRLDHVKTPGCMLLRLRRRGLLAVKIGRSWKYPVDGVEQFIQAQQVA